MRRVAPLALLIALTAGCSEPTTATALAPITATSSPASTPSPTADPACATEQLQAFLADIELYTNRGAFEDKPKVQLRLTDVYKWKFQLGMAEGLADFQVYKTILSAKEAVESWLGEEADSSVRPIIRLTIHITAQTLATQCGVAEDYAFSRAA
ncbi:hypothetical protein AB0M44_31025 [Streptosporangium subroseum]|uniref:hypothetical protein n=1 Tax=Streptosporangium subroseum TaxID=106412 RepID=UPI003424A6F8